MKIYHIGRTYIDLEHVQAINEPYQTYDECDGPIMIIVVQMAFRGEVRIPISISDEDFKGERYKEADPHYLSYNLQRTHEFNEFINAEFMRMKYNVWKPFLDTWSELSGKSALQDLTEITENLK